MKKLAFIPGIFLLPLLLTFCKNKQENSEANVPLTEKTEWLYFGDSISTEGAIDANELAEKLKGKDSIVIKLTGKIEEVCQKKGCWMNMDIGNQQSMRVRFKDYGFFVPKDAAGKTVYISGTAFTDTIPVSELRHYAEDAGKSKTEIEKITEPEISISFEANGVLIKK